MASSYGGGVFLRAFQTLSRQQAQHTGCKQSSEFEAFLGLRGSGRRHGQLLRGGVFLRAFQTLQSQQAQHTGCKQSSEFEAFLGLRGSGRRRGQLLRGGVFLGEVWGWEMALAGTSARHTEGDLWVGIRLWGALTMRSPMRGRRRSLRAWRCAIFRQRRNAQVASGWMRRRYYPRQTCL